MVEGARLESEYTSKAYRGFESLPLRHLPSFSEPLWTILVFIKARKTNALKNIFCSRLFAVDRHNPLPRLGTGLGLEFALDAPQFHLRRS